MKKNLLFTFITACMPGFGQMYYGYMRRGLSLAIWFYGLIAFSSLSGLGMFAILLPVIWAYSFFDTFNIRSLSPEQYAAFGDDYLLPNRKWAERIHLDKLLGSNAARRVVGWILIVFGGLIIYNTIFANLMWRLYDYFPFISFFVEAIPPLFIAGVVILLGLYVLKGKKLGFIKGGDDADDYKTWQSNQTPPASSAQPTGSAAPSWDARQAAAPAPTWNFTAPAAPAEPVAPMAPVSETPVAPFVAPVMPQGDTTITLSLDETPSAAEEAPAEETTDANETVAAEEATAPEEPTPENEDTAKTSGGKKGKKKE